MTAELFDKANEYDHLLRRGLRLTGEDKDYFVQGRLHDLRRSLGSDFRPRRVLDFGCGIGDTTRCLAAAFPAADVLGVDTAENAVQYAQSVRTPRLRFGLLRELDSEREFDLCYTNGVFHHIAPAKRLEAVQSIFGCLARNGRLALFENNPWNPGTRMVMSRIPFDAEAVPLSILEAIRLLRQGGFSEIGHPRFLFFFPRWLAALRPLEPRLVHLPLGGQYYFTARKVIHQ